MGVITCLAALRAERRLTQADLAALAKVSRQTINSIETGRFEPSLSLALVLAKLFERPVEQLFALPGDDPDWVPTTSTRPKSLIASLRQKPPLTSG